MPKLAGLVASRNLRGLCYRVFGHAQARAKSKSPFMNTGYLPLRAGWDGTVVLDVWQACLAFRPASSSSIGFRALGVGGLGLYG